MKVLTVICILISCTTASTMNDKSLVSTKIFRWFVESKSKCSHTCDQGFRNVTYRCTQYDDPTGVATDVDDVECENVDKPPALEPCNQHPCETAKRGKRIPRDTNKRPRFEWLHTGQWTHCINGCVKGKQCHILGCFDNERNEWRNETVCKNVKKKFILCETCQDFLSCPAMWSTSGWSACSRTCGRGTRFRSVSCVRHIGKGVVQLNPRFCQERALPHNLEICAEKDCQLEFQTTKWGKCSNANSGSCGIGTKRRKVTCLRLTSKGIKTRYSYSKCYRLYGRGPPTWQKCMDYRIPLSEECKAKNKKSKIFIHANNATVVQMKRSRRLTVQVGETAYVFPRTNIVIKCPISGYDSRDLTWAHNKRVVGHRGRRVRMNYRGRLKIKRMKYRDVGKWYCIAENNTAAVNLRLRHPTEGFREYAARLPFISVESRNQMLSDSPSEGGSAYTSGMVQWVAEKWSSCSSTCGRQGYMYRKVQCERIKNDFYKVYDDSVCLKLNLPKPNRKQKCGGLIKCPEWQINKGPGICTDSCVSIGRALIKDKLYCAIGRQVLPKESCDRRKKPKGLDYCNNTACTPRWKVSSWSQCSRSCGGKGVMARHLQCVWDKSEANAGAHCYRMKLKVPHVLKACSTPPCVLACVDLSKSCLKLQPSLCRFKLHQRYCCKTCNNVLNSRRQKA